MTSSEQLVVNEVSKSNFVILYGAICVAECGINELTSDL